MISGINKKQKEVKIHFFFVIVFWKMANVVSVIILQIYKNTDVIKQMFEHFFFNCLLCCNYYARIIYIKEKWLKVKLL